MEQIKTQYQEIVQRVYGHNPQTNFDILTDEDIEQALTRAVNEKQGKLNEAAYHAKIMQKASELKVTPGLLLNEFLARYERNYDKPFKQDKYNSEILESLASYFAGEGLDQSKGLFLVGAIGAGKTSIMKVFNGILIDISQIQDVKKTPFGIVSTQKIMQSYSQEGYTSIQRYTKPLNNAYVKNGGWCFDDVGSEENGKHYGHKANVVQEIMEQIYFNESLKGKIHVTSNLYGDMIEEVYGPRVRSRMREMFNIIDFGNDSPDRRK